MCLRTCSGDQWVGRDRVCPGRTEWEQREVPWGCAQGKGRSKADTTVGEQYRVCRVGTRPTCPASAVHVPTGCTLADCPPWHSLAVALRGPVVPLVVGLGLLREEHLVEAAGTEQVSVRMQLCKESPPQQCCTGTTQAKATDGKVLGASRPTPEPPAHSGH